MKNKLSKSSPIAKSLQLLIRGYRWLKQTVFDPLLYSTFGVVSECQYSESCSHYAERMLREHATIPALGKIVRRIWSCHS